MGGEKDDAKDGEKDDGKDGDKDTEKKDKPAKEKTGKQDPRGRALFGHLLGHLRGAKTRLETEKGWKSAALNRKAQERLEHKVALQKMGIQELNRSQYEEQRIDEEAKLSQIARTIEEKENQLLEKTLESHYSHMMNFIRTKTEPPIFYLPAKHNKDTDSMLDETRGAIKHKISSLKVELNTRQEEVDARASAAAAVSAALEGKTGRDRDEDEEEPSIPRDAPKNAKEAAEKGKDKDSDDEKSDKKSDDKSDKEESKSDKDGHAAKRRRTDDDKDDASDDKAAGDKGKDSEKGADDE